MTVLATDLLMICRARAHFLFTFPARLLPLLAFTLLTWIASATVAIAAPKKTVVQPVEATYLDQCRAIATRLKISAREVCESMSDASEPFATSHGERLIFQRSSGVDPATPNVIRVLIIGAIHGDETTSAWLAMQWARWEPPVHEGLQFSVRHLPISNPDGAFARQATRTNARGVDLNRNFPTPRWQPEAARWWERTAKRDPRRWPGKYAASELETKAIIDAIETYRPTVIVSIHAPLGVLDYDGGGLPPERIGSIWLDVVGIYPGSLGHYASRVHGVPVLTVELPNALRPVSDQESRRMWRDLFDWVKKYAQHDSNTK
jgi:murein peptide amidase A